MDPQTVFKAYDVRGRADTGELDDELYRRAGAATSVEHSTLESVSSRRLSPGSSPALPSQL